jgi:hypothetical protein
MKVLAEEFLGYLAAVFPDKEKIDAVQLIETRRAFMAGARVMFTLVNQYTELPEEEAMKKLSELDRELHEFAFMVKAGVA